MTNDRLGLITPDGTTILRAQRDEDEPLLAALFGANNGGLLRGAQLPAAMIDSVVALQYGAQTASYTANYPAARWFILELRGEAIGRLVTHEEADAIHIIDIGLLPGFQGQGIGSAVVRTVMTQAAECGRGTRATVLASNGPSRGMFRRLGFAETPDAAHLWVEMRWTAPALAPAGHP